MNRKPQVIPTWLGEFPAYIQHLWLDSSRLEPTPSVNPSLPAEGEFRFLLIPQDETGNCEGPVLVFIEKDLNDGYYQVILTHSECEMQTYSDLYVGRDETGLDHSVFISTAIVGQANVHCLSKVAVGKLIPSIVKTGGTYKLGTDDGWRRGRRFSSDLFVAQLDPRWKFVQEQLTGMKHLLER